MVCNPIQFQPLIVTKDRFVLFLVRAPQAPSMSEYLMEQYDKLFADAEHILEYKKNAIIVITIFAFLFGTLVGVILCAPSRPKAQKKKTE